jgi:hypothetical protein
VIGFADNVSSIDGEGQANSASLRRPHGTRVTLLRLWLRVRDATNMQLELMT